VVALSIKSGFLIETANERKWEREKIRPSKARSNDCETFSAEISVTSAASSRDLHPIECICGSNAFSVQRKTITNRLLTQANNQVRRWVVVQRAHPVVLADLAMSQTR
jgi:hypothetical protein